MKKLIFILIMLPLVVTADPTLPSIGMELDNVGLVTGNTYYCRNQAGVTATNATFAHTVTDTSGRVTYADIGLPDGEWFCTATALNGGLESGYSNEINFTLANGLNFPEGVPVAPSNLRVF